MKFRDEEESKNSSDSESENSDIFNKTEISLDQDDIKIKQD